MGQRERRSKEKRGREEERDTPRSESVFPSELCKYTEYHRYGQKQALGKRAPGTFPRTRDISYIEVSYTERGKVRTCTEWGKTINADLSAILHFQSIFYGSCFVRFPLVKTTLHKSLSGLPARLSAVPAPGLAGTGPKPSGLW